MPGLSSAAGIAGLDVEKYDYWIFGNWGGLTHEDNTTGSGTVEVTANRWIVRSQNTIDSWAESVIGPDLLCNREITIWGWVFCDNDNCQGFFGMLRAFFSNANRQRVCFDILNGAIRAVCADGTTSKVVDTGVTFPGNTWRLLKIIFYPGNRAEFYVDEVLKATIRDNLPAITDWMDILGIGIHNTIASSRVVFLSGGILVKIKRKVG